MLLHYLSFLALGPHYFFGKCVSNSNHPIKFDVGHFHKGLKQLNITSRYPFVCLNPCVCSIVGVPNPIFTHKNITEVFR